MNNWAGKQNANKEQIKQELIKEGFVAPDSVKQTFVLEEAAQVPVITVAIAGNKGDGKTAFALSFPGTIFALSFDKKTMPTLINMRSDLNGTKVYDAMKYIEKDPERARESARKTLEWIYFLLDEAKKLKPDWIIFDGSEIAQRIAELEMRRRSGIATYGGITNPNVWKIRNDIIADLHHRATRAAQKGIIYTMYLENKDEIIEEGTVITKKLIPKWVDAILYETDIVLRVENKYELKSQTRKFLVHCENSKFDKIIKTGLAKDITGLDMPASKIMSFSGFKNVQ